MLSSQLDETIEQDLGEIWIRDLVEVSLGLEAVAVVYRFSRVVAPVVDHRDKLAGYHGRRLGMLVHARLDVIDALIVDLLLSHFGRDLMLDEKHKVFVVVGL